MEFRSEYDKWTVMKMKAKLRECEEYRSVFLEMDLSREEREVRKARVMKLKEERNTEREATGRERYGNREEKYRSCVEECKKDEIKREASLK